MRTPTLYHLVNLSNTLANQLHYLKDRIHLHGNRPLGGSEEAHLWTPEEERQANEMAVRARSYRPPQHQNDEYLRIQGNRPAEQYAEGYAPTGDEYHWMARALPASELADHRRELSDLAHGFRSRGRPVPDTIGAHLRTAEHQLGRRIGTGYEAQSEAQRRFLNAKFGHPWVKKHHFDNSGHLPEHVSHNSRYSRSKEWTTRVKQPDGTVRTTKTPKTDATYGKYLADLSRTHHLKSPKGRIWYPDPPTGYAESPKDVNDFADRARRPQPRRRAARILERAAEENTHHGYGNHPAVMRMRADAQRQEREAEREERPPPRYSRYSSPLGSGQPHPRGWGPDAIFAVAGSTTEQQAKPPRTRMISAIDANRLGTGMRRAYSQYSESTSNPFRSVSYGRSAHCMPMLVGWSERGMIPPTDVQIEGLEEIIDNIHHLCSLLDS